MLTSHGADCIYFELRTESFQRGDRAKIRLIRRYVEQYRDQRFPSEYGVAKRRTESVSTLERSLSRFCSANVTIEHNEMSYAPEQPESRMQRFSER